MCCSVIIFTTFDLQKLICAWIIALFDADTSYHAVIVTADPLTLKVRGTSSITWSTSVQNLSETEESPAVLLIILRIFAYVMWRCGLDLWPLDLELLQLFGYHVFKVCAKFERNRIIHGWVIDDLARFCRTILWWGAVYRTVVTDAWTQLHQTWQEHRAIIDALQISCCMFKHGRLKVEWYWKRR